MHGKSGGLDREGSRHSNERRNWGGEGGGDTTRSFSHAERTGKNEGRFGNATKNQSRARKGKRRSWLIRQLPGNGVEERKLHIPNSYLKGGKEVKRGLLPSQRGKGGFRKQQRRETVRRVKASTRRVQKYPF